MNILNIKFREEFFFLSKESEASILLYYRFGNYYVEIIGIENCISNKFTKKMKIGESFVIEFDKTTSGQSLKTNKNNPIFTNSLPLNEQENKDMHSEELKKFKALEKLLRNEGLI